MGAGGYGLYFDGVNDYVSFGAAPGLGTVAFTLELWFKRTGPGVAASTGTGGLNAIPLLTKGRGEYDGDDHDMNYFLGIRATDNVLAADFEEGTGGSTLGLNHPIYGTTAITDNVWHHAAATYDGSKWQLFLDGALQAELIVNQPPRYDSIQHAAIGAALDSTGEAAGAFNGSVDEVRIWNYARTTQQIADNRGVEIPAATGLIGRWSMSEGNGITIANSSGTIVNGTLMNGPRWSSGFPIVVKGAVWKYLDNGIDQGTAWRQSAFNDGSWASGPAELGYGDGDEAKVVNFIDTDPVAAGVQKNITTYFRRTFTVTSPSDYPSLNLRMLRDDGAVVYLNGQEVRRDNMPVGAVGATTQALEALDTPEEAAFYETAVAANNLVAGSNVVAVEVHQANNGSSDLSFDLEISGSPTPTLVRGPYLQIGTPTSMIVRWRTDIPTDSRVRFGISQESLTSNADNPTGTTEHEVQVSGLTPNTKYFYSLGTSTYTLPGADTTYFFETSPPAGTPKATRIWVIGDAGTGTPGQTLVRDAYYAFSASPARHTDLWLMLGDNAYDNGTDADYQSMVFDIYPDMLKNSVVWPTLGNHDTGQETAFVDTYPYFSIFTLPKAAEAGGAASGSEHYYSFDYGNIHFICLDSMTADRSPTGAMAAWLQSDLASTSELWIIAFWHHTPYTKTSHDSDTDTTLIEMRENILPILEAGGADLVLTGHSHIYERSKLIDGFTATPTLASSGTVKDSGSGRENESGVYSKSLTGPMSHKGTVYAVVGSSGETLGVPLSHPVMAFSYYNLGSFVLDITGNRLDAKFLRESGTSPAVADSFSIVKKPDVAVTPSDASAAELGPDTGTFGVSRTGNTQFDLSVAIATSGTAASGSDYTALPAAITIPAGHSTATATLIPIADNLAEGDESVRLDLVSSVNYAQGNPSFATVTLHDKPIDAWRFLKFGAQANLAVAKDAADPDNDGAPNIAEYAFGMAPLTSSQAGLPQGKILSQTVGGQTDNYLTLQFTRNIGNTDLAYDAQVSPDLVNWITIATSANGGSPAGSGFVSETPGSVRTVTVRDTVKSATQSQRFMRVKLSRSQP